MVELPQLPTFPSTEVYTSKTKLPRLSLTIPSIQTTLRRLPLQSAYLVFSYLSITDLQLVSNVLKRERRRRKQNKEMVDFSQVMEDY
jgi:hypothetical protein